MNISQEFLNHMFTSGTESINYQDLISMTAGTEGQSFQAAMNQLTRSFQPETITQLASILNGVKKPKMNGYSIIDQASIEKVYNYELTTALESLSHDYMGAKFNRLPTQIQLILQPARTQLQSLEQKLSGTESSNLYVRDCLKYRINDVRQAAERVLYGIFAGIEDQIYRFENIDTTGHAIKREIDTRTPHMIPVAGVESGVATFQNTIYYPIWNTSLQWLNSASPIYTKVVRVKELANEFSGIPIHTKKWIYEFVNENEEVINKVAREELFSKFSPDNVPEAYKQNLKYLQITKEEAKEEINFYKTALSANGGRPFLKPLEHVRSDFYIKSIKLEGQEEVIGKVYDYRSGKVLTESMHEVERKGKHFQIKTNEPGKENAYFNLTVYYDDKEQLFKTYWVKSDSTMKDIEWIQFEFKGYDADYIYHSNMRPKSYTEVTYIEAGAEIRNDLPTNINAFNAINQRTGGNYLQEMLNMTAEYVLNHKEKIFMDHFMETLNVLRDREQLAKETGNEEHTKTDLYAETYIDLKVEEINRKEEWVNFKLGPSITAMRQKLSNRAYSKSEAQITMFGHTLSMGVLAQRTKMISGVVNEETNGKYLGVDAQVRSYAYTVGTPQTQPVDMIFVASDKSELKAKDRSIDNTLLPNSEIVYQFYGIPTFSEANMETMFMTETPIRVTNSADVRSNAQILIPSIISVTHAKMQTIRESVAEIAITGWHVKLV